LKCRELLYNFPKRYVQADSSTDAATMLGRFAPLLILALVTKGRSTELETSTELKTIIKSIAGDKGTIERAAVQTMDEGDVESMSSQIDTIKEGSIAKRKALAAQFYLDSGMTNEAAELHMQGIDFNYPVDVITVKKGGIIYQWQRNSDAIGNYFASEAVSPTRLGINPDYRIGFMPDLRKKILYKYRLKDNVEALSSTAASVIDDWSDFLNEYSAKGGGKQLFIAEKGMLENINE